LRATKLAESPARKTTGPLRPTNSGGGREAISWTLDGDVLILRIPLGRVARRAAALKVLAAIKREMGR
jgi:hypothetical protein